MYLTLYYLINFRKVLFKDQHPWTFKMNHLLNQTVILNSYVSYMYVYVRVFYMEIFWTLIGKQNRTTQYIRVKGVLLNIRIRQVFKNNKTIIKKNSSIPFKRIQYYELTVLSECIHIIKAVFLLLKHQEIE